MLIVTNGDSAVATLRQALHGTTEEGQDPSFLPWRDVLHEGPVLAGLDEAAFARERASFLATWSGGDAASIRRDFDARDRRLRQALEDSEEVVVWLEHDLYDQLQLLQLLDRMAGIPGPGRRTLLCSRDFVAMLHPDEVVRRLPRRSDLTAAQVALGQRGWRALTAPDPTALDTLRTDDLGALPFLGEAIERLLAELPGVADSLSRTERHALQALAGRARSPVDLFRAVQEREDAVFMGDQSFWQILRALGRGDRALLAGADGEPWHAPSELGPQDDALHRPLRLTRNGEAVLAGRLDRCALLPVDRWLGGYRLRPENLWRWDADRKMLVAP